MMTRNLAFHWIEKNGEVHSLVNEKKLKPIDCLKREGAAPSEIPEFLIDLVEQCGRFDEGKRPTFEIIIDKIKIHLQPKPLETPSDPRIIEAIHIRLMSVDTTVQKMNDVINPPQ